MLFIGHKVVLQAEMLLHCVADCVQTSVTGCLCSDCLSAESRGNFCYNTTIFLLEMYFIDAVRFCDILKGLFKQIENFVRMKLFMFVV